MDNNKQNFRQEKRFFLEREVAKFYLYLTTLGDYLDDKMHESTSILNIKYSDTGFDDKSEYEINNLLVDIERMKEFSNLLRQSFLTSVYSFLELWLVRECFLDSRIRDNGTSFREIKGSGLEKVKTYYSNVKKINYDFGSENWQWIMNFRRLRNCIIHRQGSLTGFSNFKVDRILQEFVVNEDGLSLFSINNHQVLIDFDFCQKALENVHYLMIELIFSDG